MEKQLVTIIIAISLIYSLYFFYKAAGTLDPGKLNIITVTGILFYLQTFAGIAMIMLGFDKHYTLKRLFDREGTITITFYVVMAMAVLFPLMMYVFTRLFKVNAARDYAGYLKKETEYTDSPLLFGLVAGSAAVCLGLMAAYLKNIGYVPLFKLFFHEAQFNMDMERVRIGSIYVVNQYVTNIMIHIAIPVMAYFAFSCAVSSKKKKWYAMAGILLAAALIVKTYNFAKAPVVYFLLVYVFIWIFHKGGIKTKWMFAVGIAGVVILFAAYFLQGVSLNIFDIYNGVWGRLLFTQVGTLSYNFELFPDFVPYLSGRSMGSLLLPLFGFSSSEQIRSGRLLMEVYGSAGVYEGTAGVMNSLFIGEAFANFGWLGLVFSIVWVAFVIAGIFCLVMHMRKTPATITMFAYFTVYVSNATQGGFTDFVYNIGWIVISVAMFICQYLLLHGRKDSK